MSATAPPAQEANAPHRPSRGPSRFDPAPGVLRRLGARRPGQRCRALIAATNAVSWSGILTAAATLVLSLLMRPAGGGTPVAALGIITGSLGLAFEALRPMIGASYAVYGLLHPAWFAIVGWKLLHLPDHRFPRTGRAQGGGGE